MAREYPRPGSWMWAFYGAAHLLGSLHALPPCGVLLPHWRSCSAFSLAGSDATPLTAALLFMMLEAATPVAKYQWFRGDAARNSGLQIVSYGQQPTAAMPVSWHLDLRQHHRQHLQHLWLCPRRLISRKSAEPVVASSQFVLRTASPCNDLSTCQDAAGLAPRQDARCPGGHDTQAVMLRDRHPPAGTTGCTRSQPRRARRTGRPSSRSCSRCCAASSLPLTCAAPESSRGIGCAAQGFDAVLWRGSWCVRRAAAASHTDGTAGCWRFMGAAAAAAVWRRRQWAELFFIIAGNPCVGQIARAALSH
jgi:hypothetical protein